MATNLRKTIEKTKQMLIALQDTTSYPVNVSFEGHSSQRVTSYNFLGVFFHETLILSDHVNHVSELRSHSVSIQNRLTILSAISIKRPIYLKSCIHT